jgi:hypothetical protein
VASARPSKQAAAYGDGGVTVPVAAAQPGGPCGARGCRRSAQPDDQGTRNVQPGPGPMRAVHDVLRSVPRGSDLPGPAGLRRPPSASSRSSGLLRAGPTTGLTCSDVLAGTTRDRQPTSEGLSGRPRALRRRRWPEIMLVLGKGVGRPRQPTDTCLATAMAERPLFTLSA